MQIYSSPLETTTDSVLIAEAISRQNSFSCMVALFFLVLLVSIFVLGLIAVKISIIIDSKKKSKVSKVDTNNKN